MPFSIPFEYQIEKTGQRCCGAAALCMVLRSFGLITDQKTVWNRLQKFSSGLNRARTFHLARFALEQDLSALPVRLKNPWQTLEFLDTLKDNEIQVVLNHRIRDDSPKGHYSVFVGMGQEDETILLHDPQFGPNRRLSKHELLRLWVPLENVSKTENEITGNVAVLFARSGKRKMICQKCETAYFYEPFQFLNLKSSFSVAFCPFCDHKQINIKGKIE